MNKGLKILFNAYWGSDRWKNCELIHEDFEIAKIEGYMFDYPQYKNHDETLKDLKVIIKEINPNDVANAFVFSLSTRKLEYRSALGSYYYAKSIYEHEADINYSRCKVCNWSGYEKYPTEDEKRKGLNILNFERYKWGGVRHDFPMYAKFDLEQFQKLPKVTSTDEDINILKGIFDVAKQLLPNSKAGSYMNQILANKVLKTNKDELSTLLGILGICDVYNSAKYKGYLNHFTLADGSRDPVEHTNDFMYPLNQWHAYDGLNSEAIFDVFGIKY